MQVLLLGTAAGGGFPQWNCWCPVCRVARSDPAAARPRTQSSAAVSADGAHWFLLNASPDVREQLRRLTDGTPAGHRHVPVEGVVLTDAELDHSMGVALLREARHLPLWATPAVERILRDDSRIVSVARAFAEMPCTPLVPGVPVPLARRDGAGAGLEAEAFVVAADPPRFARQTEAGHTVGLEITEPATGRRLVYVPGCGALDDALIARMARADLVLFDGTFWADDELVALGIGTRTARQLDHLPIGGPDGSLARLGTLRGPRRVYVHLNNTNPVLLEHSAERAAVVAAGLEVGADGMTFTL